MSDINEAMKIIGGVEPTPQQIQRVQAIAHSLGFASNDPMMAILIALDVYHGAFSVLPEKAQQAAHKSAQAAAAQSKIEIDKAIATAIQNLSPEVGKALGRVVAKVTDTQNEKSKKEKLQWLVGGSVAIALTFAVFGFSMQRMGQNAGYKIGLAELKVTEVRQGVLFNWANSEQGQVAYSLAKEGSLEKLATCSLDGYEIAKQPDGRVACVPTGEAVGGWWISSSYNQSLMGKLKGYFSGK